MRAFIVNMDNQPGTLADLGAALGERGINISGLAGVSWDNQGSIAIVTNDDSGTRTVLEEREIEYRDVVVVSASLEDRPGALGEAARRLADRGVNIEVVMPTGIQGGRISVAFGVDDPLAAADALGDLAATGASL
ncbi:MAG TPA: ACT domain-containing protein [Candidatus Limnocylindria bacterium]|jgi:hypothetical protein